MNYYCVAQFPLESDLTHLREQLTVHEVPFRFVEEGNSLYLWVAESHSPLRIKSLIEGALSSNASDRARNLSSSSSVKSILPKSTRLKAAVWSVPITMAFIALGFAGYIAFKWPFLAVIESLTYTPVQIVGDRVFLADWRWAEVWRLLTPCFLHFSLMHIAFNSAAMLQVGSRLEVTLGARDYLTLCLLTGVVGNVAQYLVAGPSLFGGLSGIVFGLFAFNGMLQRYAPSKALILPKGAYVFLVVWLVAGFTPIFEVLLGVQMGNGAHLGGAIAGLVLAYFYCLRLKRDWQTSDNEPDESVK